MKLKSGPEEGRVAKEDSRTDKLNLRIVDYEPQAVSIEELKSFEVGSNDFSKSLQVDKSLPPALKEKLKKFLQNNLDIFAWRHDDMVGIDPKISCHHLKINPKANLYKQKMRALNPESYEALKDEVQMLIASRFIRESIYPKWVSNPVLVKKHNEKWRVCVYFTNLN